MGVAERHSRLRRKRARLAGWLLVIGALLGVTVLSGCGSEESGRPVAPDIQPSRDGVVDASKGLLLLADWLVAPAGRGPMLTLHEAGRLTHAQKRRLARAKDTLAAMDPYLRNRLEFFTAVTDAGYNLEPEAGLTSKALKCCKKSDVVVRALLQGKQPTKAQVVAWGDSFKVLYPAMIKIPGALSAKELQDYLDGLMGF